MIPKTPNSRILIFDGDTLLFRQAKILQEDYIEVWWKGRMQELKNITHFKGGKIKGEVIIGELEKINKGREVPFLFEEFNIVEKSRLIESDSPEKRLGIAKKNVREYISDLYSIPWVKEIKYCISSTENYRKKVSEDYKSKRKGKPLLLKELREWFLKEFKEIAVVIDPIEADDCLGIMGNYSRNYFDNPKDSNIVLCAYDKDMLQIYNCWHFNFDHRNRGIFWIDEFTGQKNLMKQCLLGDNVDTIKGLPKITPEIKAKYGVRLGGCGESKANTILADCKDVEGLYKDVEFCYKAYYQDNYKEALNREYRLVKLLEKKEQAQEEHWVNFPFTK